jgi:hypothetical protein
VNELHEKISSLLKSDGPREIILVEILRELLQRLRSEIGTIHVLDSEKQLLPVGKGIAGQVVAGIGGGLVTLEKVKALHYRSGEIKKT